MMSVFISEPMETAPETFTKRRISDKHIRTIFANGELFWDDFMSEINGDMVDTMNRLKDILMENPELDDNLHAMLPSLKSHGFLNQTTTKEGLIRTGLILVMYSFGPAAGVQVLTLDAQRAVTAMLVTVVAISNRKTWEIDDYQVSAMATFLVTVVKETRGSERYKTLWEFIGKLEAPESFCVAVEEASRKRLNQSSPPNLH